MKITLEVTETEAIYVHDALIDKAIALRTGRNEIAIKEEKFLRDPDVSERRKQHYLALRAVASEISVHIR